MGEYFDDDDQRHVTCEICDEETDPIRDQALYIAGAKKNQFRALCMDQDTLMRAVLWKTTPEQWYIVMACRSCAAKPEVQTLIWKQPKKEV